MKNITLSFTAFFAIFMIYSCSNESKQANSTDTTAGDTLTSYDSATTVTDATDTASNYPTTFTVKAGGGGMMEVQLGTMAQQNAQSPRVKSFGAMMVRDHTKANKELMALATSKNISIPSALPAKLQEHVDEMKKLKGADFDKHYMDMMTDDHKEDIDLFERAVKNLKDQELKAFASKTLPVLHMHLDSAKAIKDAIK
jgi:putative membrane protein